DKPPPPRSLIGRSEILLPPFRPSPSLPPPSTTFPGCALLGNTISHRRSYLPATREPAPRSLSLLFPLGCQREEKKR
ncbi:Os12g0440300, partial [Oryza sativa Japonica Group]